jgi:hypothetical protein
MGKRLQIIVLLSAMFAPAFFSAPTWATKIYHKEGDK